MKILVTGGSGFLGTHVRSFLGADDLSRRSGRDILQLHDAAVAEEYDLVIHLAAHLDKSPEGADQTFMTNVDGTVNLLRSMKEGAAFIFVSTKDVYGRFADNFAEVPESCPTTYSGQSPLEWSKLIAERYVEYYANTRGFRSCILRASTVYARASEGNLTNFVGHYADAINKGEPIRLAGSGRPVRDLLFVDDLSRACLAFSGSVIRHGLYNIGGGRENSYTLREIVSEIEKASGLQAVINEDAPLPLPVPMNFVSDLALISQELDWSPQTPLADGLRSLF